MLIVNMESSKFFKGKKASSVWCMGLVCPHKTPLKPPQWPIVHSTWQIALWWKWWRWQWWWQWWWRIQQHWRFKQGRSRRWRQGKSGSGAEIACGLFTPPLTIIGVVVTTKLSKHAQNVYSSANYQTWDLSKNLHDQIFRPRILRTKIACIGTIFTHKKM